MSSGGGTTTSTQTSSPWAPTQPYLTDLMSQAQNTFQGQQGNTNYFDGQSTVAPFSPATQAGLSGTIQRGLNGSPVQTGADMTSLNLMGQGAHNSGVGSDALQSFTNGGQNPYLKSMYDQAAKDVTDSTNAQFSAGGRTGSAANQYVLGQNLNNLATNIYGNAYNTDQSNKLAAGQSLASLGQQGQVQALAQAPATTGMDWTNLQNVLSAGGAQDAQSQAQINDALTKWQYGQQQPWSILQQYGGALSGLGSLGGTATGTQTQPKQSLIPSLLGAGLAIGAAPMTGGGSLFGSMFSDARLKEDVRRIGVTKSGLPLYSFRYKGESVTHFGVMAQDVELVKPEAVARHPSGFKVVNYRLALEAA